MDPMGNRKNLFFTKSATGNCQLFFDMTKIAAVTIPTYQTFGTVESEETGGNYHGWNWTGPGHAVV